MKYVDTHAHLNLPAFAEDLSEVIMRCRAEEVAVINVGTKESTSVRAVELALAYEEMYAIIGLHPISTVPSLDDEGNGKGGTPKAQEAEVFNKDFYRDLINKGKGKVVGLGECGFDYYHTSPGSYAVQEEAFIAQIELANEFDLPLMIHTRGPKPGEVSPTGRSVYEDVFEVLKQYAKGRGNVHFYAGTLEEAKRFFDLGFTISFTGVITFAKVYEEIVKAVPLNLLHGETDCPYVAPIPYRGQRCEPWMVQEVYKKIANIREEKEEVVRLALLENAKKLYKI
jgi:TatD DNase family protein